MAVCNYCGKDMLKAKGCKKVPIIINGKNYAPIKVGDPNDFSFGEDHCSDCGAHKGHYHQ